LTSHKNKRKKEGKRMDHDKEEQFLGFMKKIK
jgi:hypothetical protein